MWPSQSEVADYIKSFDERAAKERLSAYIDLEAESLTPSKIIEQIWPQFEKLLNYAQVAQEAAAAYGQHLPYSVVAVDRKTQEVLWVTDSLPDERFAKKWALEEAIRRPYISFKVVECKDPFGLIS